MADRPSDEVHAVVAALAGHHGFGGINPTEEQLRALVAADRDGPLHFLNLLAYRERAAYPAGHELAGAGLTGEQAYHRYGAVALEHIGRRGGRLVTFSAVEAVLAGDDGPWDQIGIMEYPDTRAFLDMIADPDYVAGLVHRTAGLDRTAIVVTRPLAGSA